MHLHSCFRRQLHFEYFSEWLLLKDSGKDIYGFDLSRNSKLHIFYIS